MDRRDSIRWLMSAVIVTMQLVEARTVIARPMQETQETASSNGNRTSASDASGRVADTSRGLPAALVQYHIGPGDVLGVEVWKEPDASSPTAPVRPDGKVSLSMIGEIQAAGLTPRELEEALITRYREYVRDVRVTVMVKEINSQKVYVIGEVKKEGPIRMDAPLTVLQALAQAGGVTDFGKRKRIYVLRSQGNQQVILPFNFDAVVRGEKMEQNIVLAPGDTIVVPR